MAFVVAKMGQFVGLLGNSFLRDVDLSRYARMEPRVATRFSMAKKMFVLIILMPRLGVFPVV